MLMKVIKYECTFVVKWNEKVVWFVWTGKHNRMIHVLVSSSRSLLCHTLSAATVFTVMAITWFPYSPLLGSINLLASLLLLLLCLFKGYSTYYYLGRWVITFYKSLFNKSVLNSSKLYLLLVFYISLRYLKKSYLFTCFPLKVRYSIAFGQPALVIWAVTLSFTNQYY